MCTNRIVDRKTGYSYSCRNCDQCRAQIVNDVKGRLIAEHKMNVKRGWPGFFVTLTYGGDDHYHGDHRTNPHAQQFYWEDVRQWRERLWKAGFPHRCYIVGEVGDDRGRVHWHLVVWFTGLEAGFLPPVYADGRGPQGPARNAAVPPNIILSNEGGFVPGQRNDKRFNHWLEIPEGYRPNDEFIGPMPLLDVRKKVDPGKPLPEGGKPLWHHGWSTWDEVSVQSIGYTCSYLMKKGRVGDTGLHGQGYVGRKYYGGTTRPPLGSDYFRLVEAQGYIKSGLSPRRAIYHFADVPKNEYQKEQAEGLQYHEAAAFDGSLYDFFLPPGATRRVFLDAFVHGWIDHHGNDLWPQSDMVDDHINDMLRRARRAEGEPDVPDYVFDFEFYKRRFARGGKYRQLEEHLSSDRETQRAIRQAIAGVNKVVADD